MALISIPAVIAVWRMPLRAQIRLRISVGIGAVLVAGIAMVRLLPEVSTAIEWMLFGLIGAAVAGLLVLAAERWRTDRGEAERLRGIARRNADQVSVLSHEIRTPLTLVRGSADLLIEGTPGQLTPRQRKYLDTIRRNCEAVISLAEDLLTQARIDAGMFELRPQVVRLRPLAQSVIRELREIHQMPLALDSPGAPPQVWADPALIRQVLINLVNNAIVHARGASLITIRIVERDANVLISVSDDGEGIDDDQRRKLFERFASGRPLRNGTGLGLVITRQIVQMHGGRIFVDSVAGGGTTMMASLPSRSDPWVPEADDGEGTR